MTDIAPSAVDPPLPQSDMPLTANPVLTRTRTPQNGQSRLGWYVGIPAAFILLAGGAYLMAAHSRQSESLTAVPPSTQTLPPAAAAPVAATPAAVPTPAPVVAPAAAPVEAQAAPPARERAAPVRRERLVRNDRAVRAASRATDASESASVSAAPSQGAASATPPPPAAAPAEPPVITPPPPS